MTVAAKTKAQAEPSRWQKMWKSISIVFESRVATVGLIMVLFWLIVGLVSLVWTPHEPNSSAFEQNLGPNSTNWLGTDHLGRDIVSRLMTGTQVILLKTRLPDMTLATILLILVVIPSCLVALIAGCAVLVRIFREHGAIWGILAWIAGILITGFAVVWFIIFGELGVVWGSLLACIAGTQPLSFVWGWINAKRLQLRTTMIVWSVAIVLAGAVILAVLLMPTIEIPPISLPIGVALWGVAGSLALGATLGLLAGYLGGWWDQSIMQVLDALIAFPRIVLYLVVIAALGQGDLIVIVAITITGAPGVARLARSLALDIKTRDYIRAAETRGENVFFVMFREILPNARGPLLVDAMLRVGYAIFAIGTLGFLGIGLPPPDPDWGNMVNEARRNIFANPLAVIWPALAISTLVIGLNLFADGLSEELSRYQR